MKANPRLSLNSGIKQSYYCNDQERWWACGPASLFYALISMGINTSPESIIALLREMKNEGELFSDGVDRDGFKRIFQCYGVKSKIVKISSGQRLYKFLREADYHLPILVFPPGHVVSVFKASKSWIYYIEPDDIQKITSCLRLSDFKNYCFGNNGYTELMLLKPN